VEDKTSEFNLNESSFLLFNFT